MASAWCVAAVVDPYASHDSTQVGLLCGWIAGGTAYQVLLLLIVANA